MSIVRLYSVLIGSGCKLFYFGSRCLFVVVGLATYEELSVRNFTLVLGY